MWKSLRRLPLENIDGGSDGDGGSRRRHEDAIGFGEEAVLRVRRRSELHREGRKEGRVDSVLKEVRTDHVGEQEQQQ